VNSLTALDWQIVAKSACAGWGLTMVGMPVYLMGMRKLGWGQPIREEGPKDHQVKSGTPTMGGGLFVPMGLLASLWAGHYSANLVCLWLVTLGGWLLGLTDDLMKVMKNRNLGLKARQKVAIQTLVALGCALFVAFSSDNPAVKIPGLGVWAGILPVVSDRLLRDCGNQQCRQRDRRSGRLGRWNGGRFAGVLQRRLFASRSS
jgi:UDP-N-acetylmuramyl pentapeptide phosphotransferase/UDP-N-acetylglucosamine-1-phosphate transferase